MTTTAAFTQKLAHHASPVILGVKPANLFSLDRASYDLDACVAQFRRNTGRYGLRIRVICRCESRALLLVFRLALVEKVLQDPERRAVLTQYGYDTSWDAEACLTHLSGRIAASTSFPHETGIFLGYPAEDVLGFIEHGGENCKMTGFWKVYGDLDAAQRTFSVYTQCREALCEKLEQGEDFYEALTQLLDTQACVPACAEN